MTGQGSAFELGVEHGHVRWLRTSLTARCLGGSSWKASWAPTDGVEVHLITIGTAFVTSQHVQQSYQGGVLGQVGFAIRGTFSGHDAAQGTIRLLARFYRGERQRNACDSLDVPWAAGPTASARLAGIAPTRPVGQYLPAVPSLATGVSRARRRFIGQVDAVCVQTYGEGMRAQEVAALRNRYFLDWPLRDAAFYAEWHAWQLRRILALGPPPQARGLYDSWLANFGHRVALERHAVALYADGQRAAAERLGRSLVWLKAQGNDLGQRFGLVRCTSNGDRTPAPIFNDGQPLPLP